MVNIHLDPTNKCLFYYEIAKPLEVDSFERSSEIKSCLQFEVDFLKFYVQKERKLSEPDIVKMVRGMEFEPPSLGDIIHTPFFYSDIGSRPQAYSPVHISHLEALGKNHFLLLLQMGSAD
jgi:hypothetical protein